MYEHVVRCTGWLKLQRRRSYRRLVNRMKPIEPSKQVVKPIVRFERFRGRYVLMIKAYLSCSLCPRMGQDIDSRHRSGGYASISRRGHDRSDYQKLMARQRQQIRSERHNRLSIKLYCICKRAYYRKNGRLKVRLGKEIEDLERVKTFGGQRLDGSHL